MFNSTSNHKFNTAIYVLYVLVMTLVLLFKDYWFDEVQALNVTRSFEGLEELIVYLRYETQPLLWYVLVAIMDLIPGSPFFLLSYLPALLTGHILIFKFQTSKWIVLGYLFGYYGLFEYSGFLRPYALIQLLVVFSALLFHGEMKRKGSLGLGALLFVMSNLHLFGLILSSFIALSFYLEKKVSLRNLLFYAIICGTSIVFYIQPEGARFFPHWFKVINLERVIEVLSFLGRSFYPIPSFESSIPIWNSFILDSKWTAFLVSIFAILSVLYELKMRKKSLALFMFFFALLTVIFYIKFFGFYRHSGCLILFCLYLFLLRRRTLISWPMKLVFTLNMTAGAIFFLNLFLYDFSGATKVKNYLLSEGAEMIYADNMQVATSSVYKTDIKVFSLSEGAKRQFYDYSPVPLKTGMVHQVKGSKFSSYFNQLQEIDCTQGCFYLTRQRLRERPGLTRELSATSAMNKSERFYLYHFTN